MTFEELGVSSVLNRALKIQNITVPTDVQLKTYKHIISGRDVIACSSTGTGKTIAYLLPIISKIDVSQHNVQSLILVPTQELAVQVCKQADELFKNSDINMSSLFLIGEGNINRQIEALKEKPAIVIGTPARILQLIKMKKLKVHEVKSLVLDEADKLMDKTYLETVSAIRKSVMKRTQVLLFSASIDKKTIKSASDLTFRPIILNTQNDSSDKNIIPKTIKHYYVVTDRRERIETLRKIAKALINNKDSNLANNRTMIFINTKYDLEESFQKLKYHNYNVSAICGNVNKQGKKKALDDFKSGKIDYLLATDVAARGLQIDDISTVINVNLPEESKEYLHRAGRCGRNGKKGICISIITDNELTKIKKYQKEFNINIVQKRLYNGKLVAK